MGGHVGVPENPGLSFEKSSGTAGNLHFGGEGVQAGESQAQPTARYGTQEENRLGKRR